MIELRIEDELWKKIFEISQNWGKAIRIVEVLYDVSIHSGRFDKDLNAAVFEIHKPDM